MKKVLLSLLLCTFLTSSIFLFAEKNKAREIIPEEITMKEAYKIAVKEARNEWDPNAQLFQLTSIDETKKSSQGHNGKRRHWNFIFAVPNTKKLLNIIIHDKEVVIFNPSIEIITTENEVIKDNEIVFDSPEALKKAKENYGLKPGKDWAIGYHFSLGKFEGKPLILVVGLNGENKLTKIPINSFNGEVLH